MALTDKLSAIGDAIRAMTGSTEKLTLSGYIRMSFHQPDASGVIITRNKPIE